MRTRCRAKPLVGLPILSFAMMLLFESTAFGYSITLTDGEFAYLKARATFNDVLFPEETLFPRTLPFVQRSVQTGAGTSTTVDYDLSNAGFTIAAELLMPGTGSDEYKETQAFGGINFIPDEDLDYVLSGMLSASDPDDHLVQLRARLLDVTIGLDLFEGFSESFSTPDESFTLGEPGGDFADDIQGSLTGRLLAGHEYYFSYGMGIVTCCFGGEAFSSASATGNVSIGFTAVPEPSTALLTSLGLLGFAAGRSRRSRQPGKRS